MPLGIHTGLWSLIGLILDLIGVLLLGYDLVRIQRRLRSDAAERLEAFQAIFDENEGTREALEEVVRNSIWTDFERDDGIYRSIPRTFDPDAARASFSDAMSFTTHISEGMQKVASIMVAGAQVDGRTAGLSVRLSYAGLALILIGFLFQAVAQLPDI